MWAIFQLIRVSVLLFLSVGAVRIATALVRLFSRATDRRDRKFSWRWWLAWGVMLPISAALISLQFGGFYAFTDSRGGSWSYFGHGWPLGHQFSLTETSENLYRQSDVAIYLAALAMNLATLIAILAATRYLLDRWLAPTDAEPRVARAGARDAAAWLAALFLVLIVDGWLAEPVIVPGTSLLFYTPLAHDLWYCRLPVLVGLSCLVFVGELWLARGVKAFFRLREEGVI